ncbi:MAG: oligoribonuclease [Gammaproteobacteria bacterium]|nr:oligoribonuclease [Gammaproteobacteria bacterium]
MLPYSDDNLVWLDCEMTGLNPDKDKILEIAVVVTNSQLNIRMDGPLVVLFQSEACLKGMDKWNTNVHKNSGLSDKVAHSTIDEQAAEATIINYLTQYMPPKVSPLCGNTIGQDRRFLANYMPKLEAWFHYRNLDVSTLKELAKRWYPQIPKFKKKQLHSAHIDIHESIDELLYYRKHLFLKTPETLR